MRRALTAIERKTLDFIRVYIEQHGKSPTLREIAKATGMRYVSSVDARLCQLERMGHMVRVRGARGIRLISSADRHDSLAITVRSFRALDREQRKEFFAQVTEAV